MSLRRVRGNNAKNPDSCGVGMAARPAPRKDNDTAQERAVCSGPSKLLLECQDVARGSASESRSEPELLFICWHAAD